MKKHGIVKVFGLAAAVAGLGVALTVLKKLNLDRKGGRSA